MKKYIFLVTLAILLFASCTNQLQSEKADLTENTGVSVTLSYNIDGAFPVEILEKIQTASKVQRSAYPSLDGSYIYAYATDTLTITSETTTVEGQPVDGKNAFTIGNLTTGKTWYFTVELRDAANGGGNLLMSDSISKPISEDDSILNHVFYLKPNATSGSGKIFLPISCASSGDLEIRKIKATSKTPGWPYNSSTLFPSGAGDASLGTGTEWIPSGAYDVTLVFYNADDLAVYSETQTINIFKNMTTRIWRKNGSTATAVSNEGNFILANPLITSSARTQLYVGTPEGITANDLTIGTFASPFDSVQKAVDYIKYTGSNTKEYTINISGEQSGQVNMSHLNGKAKKIILRGTHNAGVNGNTTDVITAGLESSRTDGNTLRINTNFPVEIKNLTITGGKTSGSGGGIIITSGELILGQDTRITGNTASIFGGGILVQDDSVLKIESNVYIFGNTDGAETPVPSNLYLPSGKKIRITGPLSQGSGSSQKKAKIGVSSPDAPTVTTPVPITQGYGYQKANGHNIDVLPGEYFIGDAYGVSYDAVSGSGEAVLAVSTGIIYTSEDYTFTPALAEGQSNLVYFGSKKTFTLSNQIGKRLISGATPTYQDLYYKPGDKKLYENYDSVTNAYSVLDPSCAGTAVAEISAALYSGGTKVCDLDVNGFDITVAADSVVAPGNYKLKVFTSFLGRKTEKTFTIAIDHKAETVAEYIDSLTASPSGFIFVEGPVGPELTDGLALVADAIKNKNSTGITIKLDATETINSAETGNYIYPYFKDCQKLTAIKLPDWMYSIIPSLFEDCTGLTSVTLGENIKEIYQAGFKGCTSLSSITLPASVKEIGLNAFTGCNNSSAITINFAGTKEQWGKIRRPAQTADAKWHDGATDERASAGSVTCTDGNCGIDYRIE